MNRDGCPGQSEDLWAVLARTEDSSTRPGLLSPDLKLLFRELGVQQPEVDASEDIFPNLNDLIK